MLKIFNTTRAEQQPVQEALQANLQAVGTARKVSQLARKAFSTITQGLTKCCTSIGKFVWSVITSPVTLCRYMFGKKDQTTPHTGLEIVPYVNKEEKKESTPTEVEVLVDLPHGDPIVGRLVSEEERHQSLQIVPYVSTEEVFFGHKTTEVPADVEVVVSTDVAPQEEEPVMLQAQVVRAQIAEESGVLNPVSANLIEGKLTKALELHPRKEVAAAPPRQLHVNLDAHRPTSRVNALLKTVVTHAACVAVCAGAHFMSKLVLEAMVGTVPGIDSSRFDLYNNCTAY